MCSMVLTKSEVYRSAIVESRSIKQTMIATPTKAGHPSKSYRDTNARVSWNVPETSMRP